MNLYNLLAATACVAFAPAVSAQTPAPEKPRQEPEKTRQETVPTYPVYPSGKLIGLQIRDAADKGMGEIGDLLIDPTSGEIRYALLEVGGFLGVGEDRRVVPWSFVQIVPDAKDSEKCEARTKLTEAQVKDAPKAKKDAKFDGELDKRVEAAFGKNEAWAYAGKGEPTFLLCSDMDDVDLRDPLDKDVGKIQDIVLAPTFNCVAFAVVDTTKEAGDNEIAVPFGRIDYAYDEDKKLRAKTSIDLAKFAAAPKYDKKEWKRISSKTWLNELSTYYGVDPFWKSARPVSAPNLPPPSKT